MLAITATGESSAGAVRKHRVPTPDHPPYSWMIGEAIAALGEGGGSAEDAISDFIRARHPGVPAAHDRFLRHYLAKHVAEGLFVCTAPGRYSCRTDDEDESEPVRVLALEEGPAAVAKRGRGRPRKDGSAPRPTPASDKKVGDESRSTTPKRGRGRPRKDGSPAAPPPVAATAPSPATEGKRGPGRPRKDGSSPSPAAKKKGGSGSPSATPKRRGRPRVLPRTAAADVSVEALVTDKKNSGDAPSTTDNNCENQRELALVVVIDRSSAPSVTEDDGGEAASAKLPLVAKEPAAFTTPERTIEPCKLALVAADEGSAPALVADKEDSTQAASEGSPPALVADKEDGTQAPLEGSALALPADKKDATQAPVKISAPPLVSDYDDATQAPFESSPPAPVADKVDGTQTPLEGSAPVLASDKEDGAQAPPEGSAPWLVADNDDCTKPAFTKHKRRRRTCRLAPVKGSHAPAWTSVAENKASGKAASAPPKGRSQQRKPASPAAGELRPRRPVPIKPRKMLLLNPEKVPERRMFCVLALPAPVPAATKA